MVVLELLLTRHTYLHSPQSPPPPGLRQAPSTFRCSKGGLQGTYPRAGGQEEGREGVEGRDEHLV